MRIHDHDTLRALNRALAEKYGTNLTCNAIDYLLNQYSVQSVGHLRANDLDSFYDNTIRILEET